MNVPPLHLVNILVFVVVANGNIFLMQHNFDLRKKVFYITFFTLEK